MPTVKEAVYDQQINPLMAQIIDICHSNKIAMLADFHLGPDKEDGILKCTTALLEDGYEPGEEMLEAFRLLRPDAPRLYAFTITKGCTKP